VAADSVPGLRWAPQPQDHDYDAALDYLTLVASERASRDAVRRLRKGALTRRRAKDILRASKLACLPASNPHVARDMRKPFLSPVLLVQGPGELIIADGYHRVCAVYLLDEDAWVPCKLASLG